MALGDIWLAGKDGSCENAGACPAGPCGPGENPGDCPDFWTHTKTVSIEYPGTGQRVKIDGVWMNPGQTIRPLRGELVAPRPYEYPIEVFRAAIETPDPVEWDPEEYTPARIILTGGDGDSQYVMPVQFIDQPTGTGPGWPTPPGTAGLRYGSSNNLGFGSTHWIYYDGTKWVRAARGGSPSEYLVWGAGTLSVFRISDNVLVTTYDVEFVDPAIEPPPQDIALPAGVIQWGFETYPAPKETPYPGKEFVSIPEEAAPDEAVWGWDKTTVVDVIKLLAVPSGPVTTTISLTIRSACENPLP